MKRETYVKRLVTSYKNLNKEEKKMFRKGTDLIVNPKNPEVPEKTSFTSSTSTVERPPVV